MPGGLSFITTNGAMRAYDADQNRQRVERRERQETDVDAAMRGGLSSIVAAPVAAPPQPAQQQAAPRVQTAASTVNDPADDDDAAVRTLIGEAANQGEQGMAAVAHVIRNRARQAGASPRDVVLAPSQFEPWQTRRGELMAIDRNSPQYQEALRVWRATGDGSIADPTGGADHFLNPTTVRQRTGGTLPAWAQGQGTQVGDHTFYSVGYRGGAPARTTPAAAPAQAAPQQQPGNPLLPAIQQLLRVPGGGRAALQLLQAGEQMQTRRETADYRRQQLDARLARLNGQGANGRNSAAALDLRERQGNERNMMIALGRGEVDLARAFAERAGISLPDQVWQDRANHARFAAGSMLARRYYTDRNQAAAFVREYLTDGNALRAAEAVGAPRGREQGWRPLWVQEGEQQVLRLLNPGTGEVRAPQGANGEPTSATRPPRGAGGRGGSVWQQRREALMRVFDGDEPMVDRLMTGIAPTPRQIAQAYQKALATAANDPAIMSNPGAQQQRAEATMDGLFPNWRQIRDRQQPPAAAQPAAPTEPAPRPSIPPRPPSVPVGSAYSPSRRMWRSPDGRIFDEVGRPVA